MTRNTHRLDVDHEGTFQAPPFTEQVSDPATPDAGTWVAYFKDGGLFIIDDTGAVTGPLGTGGGGECEHMHTYERFVAAGGSPETFTLDAEPLYPVDVRLEGASVDPDLVTVTGADVELDTTIGDIVVIWYAKECAPPPPPSGPLAVPGTSITWTAESGDGNLLATIETTGPGVVVVDVVSGFDDSSFSDYFLWLTDDLDVAVGGLQFPTQADGIFMDIDPTGTGLPTDNIEIDNPGKFYLMAPRAGTWYLFMGSSGYDADITGAGTYEVLYPTGTPSGSLAFPGVDASGTFDSNGLAVDIAYTGPKAVFVTIDEDLPADLYRLYIRTAIAGTVEYLIFEALPILAGTYTYVISPADSEFSIFASPYFSGGAYDPGLTNSGTYEIVDLPT